MSDRLDVRQLRYFVAVAEELHFGRAATRLGIAQPPLSKAIAKLERDLGASLLRRTTRQVSLTPAGEVLLTEARSVLVAVAAAEARTRHAAGGAPALRLAFKADFDAGLLPGILAAFAAESSTSVELLMGARGEQVAAVREGRAEIAMLPRPFEETGLDVEELLTEPRVVAMAADDPLAARTTLELADLRGRELPDGRSAYDESGVSRRKFGDLAQIFNAVELGSTVWFLPASLAERHPRRGIAYRPVDGLDPSVLCLAWPHSSRSTDVAAFVRAAVDVAGLRSGQVPPAASTAAAH